MHSKSAYTFALICVASLTLGCTERGSDPVVATRPSFTAKPGQPGDASERLLYQVRLGALGGFSSHGVMLIEIVGGYLTVSVHASGHAQVRVIPQHIHVNPTCNPGGGILINLDANITVPGEGPSVGPAYPSSNNGGVIKYYASRSLTDLLAAVNTHLGLNLTSVDALLTWLDLENRNAHMHVPDAPFTPVNCGEIDRVN